MIVSLSKKIFIIPIILFILSLGLLVLLQIQTGSYINKGIDLTGGRLITLEYSGDVDQVNLENELKGRFGDVSVRVAESVGSKVLLVQTDIKTNSTAVINYISGVVNIQSTSSQEIGASLGKAFWEQTQLLVSLAFLVMAFVVFIIFREKIPSVMVIFNSFSNVVITLAIMNVLGIKLTLAGLAGILMLLGYSVDTNILLTTRVLKSRDEEFEKRISSSFNTGIMMTATTLVALLCLYVISISHILSEIALILIIGLLVDTMNTWTVNVMLLSRWIEKKGVIE